MTWSPSRRYAVAPKIEWSTSYGMTLNGSAALSSDAHSPGWNFFARGPSCPGRRERNATSASAGRVVQILFRQVCGIFASDSSIRPDSLVGIFGDA